MVAVAKAKLVWPDGNEFLWEGEVTKTSLGYLSAGRVRLIVYLNKEVTTSAEPMLINVSYALCFACSLSLAKP